MHTLRSRARWLAVCGALVLILAGAVPTAHARGWSIHHRAMHPTAYRDIAAHADVPRYTSRGSVDVATRTVTMEQHLEWVNTTGVTVTLLPFRLYANLPDFAGQTTIVRARIDGVPVGYRYNPTRSIVEVILPYPLAQAARVVVSLDYQTTIPSGLGQTKYGAFNDDGTTLSFASPYPLLAMSDGGVWQTADPDTKGDLVNSSIGLYDVTLTIPSTHRLVSTGSTIDLQQTPTTQTVRVVSGLQRDFAFVLTTLPATSAIVDGTRVTVYAAPSEENRAATQTLIAATQALRLFNARFGQYPYGELDVVAVDAASFYGVEYPGLILMQDRTVASGKRLESTVVHEVAHQWFYNLVGNDVQADAWVDESLATYAQVIYRRAYGGEDAAVSELAELQRQYDRLIERELDAPVHQHMRDYTLYTFNVLAYAKGALFYEALRNDIGPDAFDRTLLQYVNRYRYTSADSTSMRDIATTICACSVDALFATWIHPSLQRRLP